MKYLKMAIVIPLLILDLYGIVRLIINMVNNVTEVYVGVVVLFVLAIAGFMLIWALVPLLRKDNLLQKGTPAAATVLQVWDTGVTVNELNIKVGLLLEVNPPGGPAYQAKTTTLVPRIHPTLYQPGMVVQVRYDPNKPAKVVVV